MNFWDRTKPDGSGCLLFMGARDGHGYGALWDPIAGRPLKAHRVAYELCHGPIAEGMHVLHTCDVPACVNPAHLRVGTHAENMADKMAKGRHRSWHAEKTHCLRGHEFDESNTMLLRTTEKYPYPRRVCRTCQNERNARRRLAERTA